MSVTDQTDKTNALFCDPFAFVFERNASVFLRPLDLGIISMLEGDPGTGKTLLALSIARRLVNFNKTVFFQPFEQSIESVKLLAEGFSAELGDLFKNELESRGKEEETSLRFKVPKLGHGGAFFYSERPTNLSEMGPDSLIDWVDKRMKHVSRAFARPIDMVIIDNANVVPHGRASFAFLPKHLHEIRERVRNHRTSAFIVLEGNPREYDASHVEYHADVVIRLSPGSYGTDVRILKTRNRATPPGIHSLLVRNQKLDVFPSPATVLLKIKDALKEPDVLNPKQCEWDRLDNASQLRGWKEHFCGLLRPGDIVCVDGSHHAGKSEFVRTLAASLSDSKKVSPLLIVDKLEIPDPIRAIGIPAQTIQSDPLADRNELFFTLASHICSAAEQHGVFCLDSLTRLEAGFPQIADDVEFITCLLKLLRMLKCAAILECQSNSVLARAALELCDVTMTIRDIQVDHGNIKLLELAFSDSRSRKKLQHPVLLMEHDCDENFIKLDSHWLHTWVISMSGSAKRVNVNLMLPTGSPAERTHAEQLKFLTSHIVGHEQVRLLGLVSGSAKDDTNTDEVDRYYLYRMIASMAVQKRDDLTIAACDDHVFGLLHPRGDVDPICKEILQNLEPLGSLSSWNDILGEKARDILISPIEHNGQVVAVPYMLDTGCLAYKKTDAPKPSGQYVTWDEIIEKNKFSFNHAGRESRISLLLEFLQSQGDFGVQEFSAKHVEQLKIFIRLVKSAAGRDSFGQSFLSNNDVAVRRDWYSNLSNLRKSVPDYTVLIGQELDVSQLPASNSKMLCAVRFLIIPKGAACKELGIDLIKEFVQKDMALERVSRFVGLSPFMEHYNGKAIRLPSWLTRHALLQDKDRFATACVLRSKCTRRYAFRHNQLADLVAEMIFNTGPAHSNKLVEAVRDFFTESM